MVESHGVDVACGSGDTGVDSAKVSSKGYGHAEQYDRHADESNGLQSLGVWGGGCGEQSVEVVRNETYEEPLEQSVYRKHKEHRNLKGAGRVYCGYFVSPPTETQVSNPV